MRTSEDRWSVREGVETPGSRGHSGTHEKDVSDRTGRESQGAPESSLQRLRLRLSRSDRRTLVVKGGHGTKRGIGGSVDPCDKTKTERSNHGWGGRMHVRGTDVSKRR